MAWNRPSAESAAQRQVKKSKVGAWYAVLGASCLVLVAGLVWFMMSSDDGAAKQSREKGGKIIKAAKAAKAAKSSPPTSDAEGQAKKNAEQKMDVFAGPKPTPIKKAEKPLNLPPVPKRTFSTGVEQVMSWIFNAKPGGMPPILPPMSDEELKELPSILVSKCEIGKDDSEALANCKETVNFAKKEMMKYIREGGDPQEFLRYYHNELRRCFEWREEAIRQAEEVWNEDHSLGKDFIKRINEKFSSEGIMEIEPDIFGDDDEPEQQPEQGTAN